MKNIFALVSIMLSSSILGNTISSDSNPEPGRGVSTLASDLYFLKGSGCIDHDGVGTSNASTTSMSFKSVQTTSEYTRTVANNLTANAEEAVKKVKIFALNGSHSNVRKAIEKSKVSVGEVLIRKEFERVSVKNPRSSAFVRSLLDSTDNLDLYDYCGNSYIHGFRKIIETTGYISCTSTSVKKKRKLDNSFDGFGIFDGVKIGGSASRQVDETLNRLAESCSISFFSRGGAGDIDISSVEKFIDSAISYALSSKITDAWIDDLEIISYDDLLDVDMKNLLLTQQIAFTDAKRLIRPISSSYNTIVSLVLSSSNASVIFDELEDTYNLIQKCIEEPWDSSNCVSDLRTIPFPF